MAKFSAEASIRLEAGPARVWKALTQPILVREYLFNTEMKTDWRVGSPITYRGVWQGKEYEDKGQVLEFRPVEKIVTSYLSGNSGLPDLPENYQIVTYTLKPDGRGTIFKVLQDGIPSSGQAEHSRMNWETVLQNLKRVLEKS